MLREVAVHRYYSRGVFCEQSSLKKREHWREAVAGCGVNSSYGYPSASFMYFCRTGNCTGPMDRIC